MSGLRQTFESNGWTVDLDGERTRATCKLPEHPTLRVVFEGGVAMQPVAELIGRCGQYGFAWRAQDLVNRGVTIFTLDHFRYVDPKGRSEDEEPDDVDEYGDLPLVPLLDGAPVQFVAAYEIERCYGGPEEGGWWYDAGTLVAVRVCKPEDVDATVAALEVTYPRTRRRSSVRGGEDYDVRVTDTMPVAHFPESRPHYE